MKYYNTFFSNVTNMRYYTSIWYIPELVGCALYNRHLLEDLLLRLEGGLAASTFLLDLDFGFSDGECELPTCKENRWVMIVWNSHDVVRILPPAVLTCSTPRSESWRLVLGSDVRTIVLCWSPFLLRDFSTSPPAAAMINCSACKGGALLSATPLQIYTEYPARTPPLRRASSPFSSVSFIEKLYAASAALSPNSRKSLGSRTFCWAADCSTLKLRKKLLSHSV